MTLYTLEACHGLMGRYMDRGGEVKTIEEGCLGLGVVICYGPGLKTTIIREIYLNAWSSGHTIRKYNKTPAKYRKYID